MTRGTQTSSKTAQYLKVVVTSLRPLKIELPRWLLVKGTVEGWTHLNEMVLRALSATLRALSISVASRWKAMYWSHTRELSGDWSTRRS